MSEKIAVVTGANAGIGKELVRQLATSHDVVYLACRSAAKAAAAVTELEQATGKKVFRTLTLDTTDLGSVRHAVDALDGPVDDVFLNAGGSGGKTPMARTTDGVTHLFASNVLGHVMLLERLIDQGKLRHAAILTGSEAARGVPKLHMKRPSGLSTVEDFASICDGSFFAGGKVDGALAYGQVKYVGALAMAALARRNPALKILTVSPGNTAGTEIAEDYPFGLRVFMKYVFMPILAPLMGQVHGVKEGAARLVEGLALPTGTFYASEADQMTGPMIDQRAIFADVANEALQDHALEAVHRFVAKS